MDKKELRDIPVKEPAGLAQDRMKYVLIGGICLGVLLIVSMLIAIFAMRSSREAQSQVKVLSEELESASSALTTLQGRYDDLELSYGDLKTQFDELKTDNEELKAQHDVLKTAYEELETAYNSLVEENNHLKTDVEAAELDAQNKALEKEMIGLYRPESVNGLSMGMAQLVYRIQGGEGKLSELYSVELQAEGKGVFKNAGTDEAITWRLDGEKLILERDDFYSEAVYQDSRITLTVEDMEVVLAKDE